MPATFTHPVAVLPLKRWCPKVFNFAALIIGSMSPDLGYFFRQFGLAREAHTLWGTLIIALPSGLVTLALFYLLRRPLCFMLPQPHRSALMPMASRFPSLSVGWLLRTLSSLLIGAWTHTVWDSFTHPGAWSVERISSLREAWFHIAGTEFAGSYVLQQLSTFGGGALLVAVYWIWLRRQPLRQASEPERFTNRHRYITLMILAILSLFIALPSALEMASRFEGYLAFRVFVFRSVVYSLGAFVPLMVGTAVALAFRYRPKIA